ncbi:MAG: hypothetical protein IJV25_05785 [Prevotella sp.]|nr:hypothetical protein [Prevotella sp.]
MRKKLCIIWGVLISFGMFCACSSDDDMSVLMNDKLKLFEDSTIVVPDYDYTGYLYYDNHYGWSIIPGIPYDYSSVYYFPMNLPEELKSYKDRRQRVSYSGKVIQLSNEEVKSLDLWQYDGRESFYFVYLTKIKVIEGGGEIPYRGDPPFIVTDMPGVVFYSWETDTWYVRYYLTDYDPWNNAYYPTVLSDEFKVPGLHVIVSGNVYEEDTEIPHYPGQKIYKIELTKIEKAE